MQAQEAYNSIWSRLAQFNLGVDKALQEFPGAAGSHDRIPPRLANISFYGHDLTIWSPMSHDAEDMASEPALWKHTKGPFQSLMREQFGDCLCGFCSVVFLDHLRKDRFSFLHMEVNCPTSGNMIHPKFFERSNKVIENGIAITHLALLTPAQKSVSGQLDLPKYLVPVVFAVSLAPVGCLERLEWEEPAVLQVSVSVTMPEGYKETGDIGDWQDFPEPLLSTFPPKGEDQDTLYSRVRQVYPGLTDPEIRRRIGWNCARSEERRVWTECRSRWSPYH